MAGSHSRCGEAAGDDSSRHLLKLARLDGGMEEVGAGRSDEVEEMRYDVEHQQEKDFVDRGG